MPKFIETYYGDVCVHYWISKKGYYYAQSENDSKPRRISEEAYVSAYEHHYNI